MACAVAALTVELLLGHPVRPAVLALTVPALALDAVDGRVARRTGTVTAFGGRFDGEVDAFLILVLSVAAAPTVGWWVLAAGLVRYAFAVAGWCLPWMRAPLEFRYWRKVVTAVVGIALTVAVADVLPPALTTALRRGRHWVCSPSRSAATWSGCGATASGCGSPQGICRSRRGSTRPGAGTSAPRPWRRVVTGCATTMAVALVWFALVAPARPDRLTPGAVLGSPSRRSSWPRSCSWCRPGRPGP